MSEAELLQTDRVDETPPAPAPDQAPAAVPPDEDAALDAELEAQAIDIPDGEKLVPLSAVTGVRGKLKDAKGAAAAAKAEADAAKQQVAQYAQWVQDNKPYIDAARALSESRGQPQAQPQEAPQDDPELVELARTLDLYGADGKPDAAKAKAIVGFIDKRAGKAAEQQVAPMQQYTVQQQAHVTLARAKNTSVNGVKADPAILDALWARTPAETTANPEAAKWLLATAIGLTTLGGQQPQQTPQPGAQRGPDGKFLPAQTAPQIPDPLYTEKAGGRVDVSAANLSAAEQKIARELFASEKDPIAAYVKHANTMPKGWGKGR